MAVRVNIEKIEDGMVLNEPVLNKHGQILLGKDIELKSKHIRILKSWNVQFVYIKKNDVSSENKTVISKELLKMAVLDLKKIIKWIPENKYEVNLINACVKFNVLKSK
jgi:hypothetical protein